jgi:hypothetical protein
MEMLVSAYYAGVGGWNTDDGVITGKLPFATVSGEDQRQQVETHSHRWPSDEVKAERSGHRHTRCAGSAFAQAAFAVIGRHRALLSRAFLLMAWFPTADSGLVP